MKKAIYFLMALFSLALSSGVSAQTMPKTDGSTYYHVVFKRSEGPTTKMIAMTDNGAGNNLTTSYYKQTDNDSQLFKVEKHGTGRYYILTSKLGNKVYLDGNNFKTHATTGTPLYFKTNAGYQGSWELKTDSTQNTGKTMNPYGGSRDNNVLKLWNDGDYGNFVMFLAEDAVVDKYPLFLGGYAVTGTQRVITSGKIEVGSTTYATLPNGLTFFRPGNSPQIIAKRGDKIKITVSGADNTKWGMVYAFFDWNQDGDWALDGTKNDKTEIVNNNFVFTPAADGERYLIAQGAAPNKITDAVYEVTVPATATLGKSLMRLKMDEQRNTGTQSDPSDPLFRIYTGSIYDYVLNILSPEDFLKITLKIKIDEATAILAATTEGTRFGQYPAAARTDLSNAIVTAQGVYDNGTATETEINNAVGTINTAITTYNSQVIFTYSSLLSSNPDNNRWYRLKNRFYSSNDIIASNTVAENGGIITQNSGTANDNELWRFELNAGGTAVKIVNKATGLAIKENGQSTQSTLVNLSTATEFVFSHQDIYWAIGRVNASSHQYLHRDGSSKLVGWEAIAPASHWTLQYVEETPKATRTLTVASANPGLGTAVITGTENTSATTYNPISATATATDPNYFFTNWTNAIGGAVVSSSNPFVYTGTEDLEIRANFVTNGIPVAPMASTTEHPVYYMIQSASNATHSFNNYTGDFRGNVLISPTAAGKIIHNKLSTATSTDHALWQIVNVEGIQLLKNKATGFYMTGSHSVGATGAAANAFTFDLINGSTTQYKLRTADASGSYINTWLNNLADRLSTGDQANSLIAWHFIAPAFTGNTDFSNTTDWTNGVAPTENMAVAINSDATVSVDRAFSGLHIAAGKTLTVNAGKALTVYNSITGPGTLVLKSDATSGTATVTGNVSGNATVEQYLPAGAERTWWYLASPVTGAAWTVFGSNQVGSYSEASRSYSAPFTATETLTAGKGYVVKMNAAQAANVYQFANKALNNGNISVPLTRTVSETLNNKRGFNLVGNPYPSYLNWELAHKASTNVRSTIWYRTKGTSAMEFHTYNAALGVSVPTAASGYIPPMQAFWVKVDTDPVSPATVSTGTLNFTNAMRGHAIQGTTTPLKAPATNSLPLLRIALSNGSTSDETVIALHANASANFDQYDSEKMINTGTSEVFTLAGTQELTINAQPDSEGSKLIPLGIRPANAGSLNLSVSELKNLDNMQVILHDNVLKTETQLSLNQSYHFTTDGTATNNRFSIEFRAPGMTTDLDNSDFADFNITVYSGKIQIQSPAMANGQLIRVYSSNGQKIIEQTAEANNTIIDHKLSSGVYFVKVSNYVQKIIIQ